MADNENLPAPMTAEERGASKLHDPTPQRRKYVIELLYKFMTNQISFAQMTGISQKDLYLLSEVGHVKLKHGRVDEAKRIFDCLVQIDHKNPFYHACLGSIYQKMNKFVDAVYEFSEALKFKKDDVSALVNRGEIYLIHKNFKKAAEDFRAAILLDPLGKNTFANRARSLVIAIKRNLQAQKAAPVKGPAGPAAPQLPGGGTAPGARPALPARGKPMPKGR
ncbi:MAG: tetratricopeptide repeat protein [Deltaproteobacteria bacterium]|nr:tetratricopeptide repeat protein [Deltaproteobacteria bacterium]